PGTAESTAYQQHFSQHLTREYRASDLLRRPEVTLTPLLSAIGLELDGDSTVHEQVEIQAKYAGYVARQSDEIARQNKHQETSLPIDIDYTCVTGLSSEVKQKLTEFRPETIGQASRIPGITPAAVSLLLVYLKKSGRLSQKRRA
ncbi:MAG TPA: tRNA uridine-5-carboxymethylaminomethyl(34) synthesis enzyme MnmG, partial [Gammaproteobacteria bacterium]|nr:tRNA uridine-5-carboxymethylaminomethyl(34) synthesis enzyme MnmG [Gammaproteobacteria bacterium]